MSGAVIFPSVEFALFFPLVLGLSWLLMPRPRLWKPFVLVASYAFYMAASWKFGVLLGVVTLGNQLAAVLLARTSGPRARKSIVALAVVLDLGVLAAFKYYGFFAQEINGVLGDFGLALSMPLVAIAIPLGVSFYVFQAISYVVDVYRGVIERGRTIDVAIYLSFFPHVVAGPIVRAREFLPQLERPRDPREVAVGAAVVLIAVGLVKKVAIADTLAREVVDPVFAVPEAYAAPDVALAAYAYAVQIYCDFSGYTDIAIGVALLMGFVFPQNFRAPYRATSIREFWRRWHITLSRYLRDFLYIPLGGNRGSTIRTYRNLMVTMLLGGLWHGASWNYVLWGAYHGVLLIVARAAGSLVPRTAQREGGWMRPLQIAGMFVLTLIGWLIFRETELDHLWRDLRLTPATSTELDRSTALYLFLLAALYSLPLWIQDIWAEAGGPNLAGAVDTPEAAVHWPRVAMQALVCGLMLAAVLTLRSSTALNFIYFSF